MDIKSTCIIAIKAPTTNELIIKRLISSNLILFLKFLESKKLNKNIINIRKKLDKLDIKFLNLIKKRTLLVDEVLKNKKFKKDIVDKKRIKVILKNISKKSKSRDIDNLITKRIWRSMIKAFIDYEYRNFKKK